MNYKLENFPYLTQTDNKFFSTTSCYPTSMSMAIEWCLQDMGINKHAIGCPLSMQLEDYITQISESKATKIWIKNNISIFGNWMLDYKPRTIAYVEEMIFNKLMLPFGYRTKFDDNLSYEDYCDHIEGSNMPIVLHGSFSSVSKVSGHIVCGVGFNTIDNTVLVMDPYGNAVIDAYKSHGYGQYAEYPVELLIKDTKNNKMWGQLIEKVRL